MSLSPNNGPVQQPEVFIVEAEYEPLSDLVCASERATVGISLLWRELERATMVPEQQAPADLVRMGSRVHFTDLTRREQRMVRLVFPAEASEPTLVSATSGLGAALIGLRVGDVFEWWGADQQPRRVRVDMVGPPPGARIMAARRPWAESRSWGSPSPAA